ncbi:MAG TPA: hypothetical protein VIO38_11565, partial [Rariglobus sp.]
MKPRNRQPVVRSVRTPEALEALRARLVSFDPVTRQRGTAYFKSGAVVSVRSEADHLLKAQVAGGSLYTLTWFLTRGEWTSRCSCPVGTGCKHAYAAGLAWIAAVEAGERDGRNPDDIVPTVGSPFASAATVGERALETELAGWLRALPSAEEKAFADRS